MKFLVQGLLAMVIMALLAIWVAAIPTTDTSDDAAKAGFASNNAFDLLINLQADQ